MDQRAAFDIVDRDTDQPLCPLCGLAMALVRTTLRADGALQRFECSPCGVTFSEVSSALMARPASAPAQPSLGVST